MIKLWEKAPGFDSEIKQDEPSITPYIVENEKSNGAIIVFPGGGYEMKAFHEGEPVAKWLNSIGISAFVLDYRVAPYKHPYPSMDAMRAVRYVRYYAKQWNIDTKKIGILGFSAGGHLASTVGVHYDLGDPEAADPIDRMSSRPDCMVLCYPVITFGEYRHDGSMRKLLGNTPDEEMRELLSNEKHVTGDTPPTFIWHTADDRGVPVKNSIMFADSLSENSIPYELHIFKSGNHGLGLAEDRPSISIWTKLCENWLRSIDF